MKDVKRIVEALHQLENVIKEEEPGVEYISVGINLEEDHCWSNFWTQNKDGEYIRLYRHNGTEE